VDTTLSERAGMKSALPFPPRELLTNVSVAVRIGVFGISLLFATGSTAQHLYAGTVNKTPTFITFAAPDAGTNAGQGTNASAINAAGDITGSYQDASNSVHGFVRASDGKITEFDAPSASGGTVPVSINAGGDIAGFYVDTDHVDQAFVRTNNGSIVEFNVLDSWTSVGGINAAGDVAGYYAITGIEASEGFVRSRNGAITAFDEEYVIFPFGINTAGDVAGYYLDSNLNYYGFVRDSDGKSTKFALPGGPGDEPYLGGINEVGDIAGFYFDGNTGLYHGFVRASNGKMTTFEAPSAGKGYLQGTVALDINTAGSVTGYYVDSKNIIHGFVRASNGVITDFDVPGTILTSPYAINTAGDITGYCIDANNVHQGFMRKP
jgi:hypothetical protein